MVEEEVSNVVKGPELYNPVSISLLIGLPHWPFMTFGFPDFEKGLFI